MQIMRRGVGDFVNANFPEPHNPIWRPNWDPSMDGVGDFVLADFPEPYNPIWHGQARGIRGIGCGGGCGCDSCSGMGALTVPAWALSLPAPLNESSAGIPNVYWGLGLLGGGLILPAVFGKKGRR